MGKRRRRHLRYPVVLLARNPSSYEPLVAEIEKAGGRAVGIGADVTSPTSVQEAFARIAQLNHQAGDGGDAQASADEPVRVAAAVFNGAGGFSRKPFLDLSLEEFRHGAVAPA